MPGRFPDCADEATFERIRRDDALLRPGVEAIVGSPGDVLGDAGDAIREPDERECPAITRFPAGSLPVYAIGTDRVLKLYPPLFAHERHTEAALLDAVSGKVPVPTPRVVANDALDGWGYLLMTRLSGLELADAWPDIAPDHELDLAEQLGTALAALHAVTAPDVPAVRIDWAAFMAEQRRTAVARQSRHGLDPSWLAQIPAFLDSVTLSTEPSGGPPGRSSGDWALLHTEVMREHLLVTGDHAGWRLTGLFDFEPAMRGAPEYEFASVGLFFSCGDARILRRVLRAYGYSPEALDRDLERRLLAYALLHRYSNLGWYLERLPADHGLTTLDELATYWFGVQEPD